LDKGDEEVKWLLLVLIFFACTVVGVWIDEDQRKRIKELEKFIYLFELLKAEIDYQLTPLKEACVQAGQREERGIGKIFLNFANQLEAKESVDLNAMWMGALEAYKGQLHLQEKDYEMLSAFSGACGYLDKNMQKRNLDMIIEKIQRERKLSEEKYERCSKLNKSLGALIGAALVIFLI